MSLTAAFDAGVHPRGKDGKFIEKLGMVELFGDVKTGRLGRKTDVTGQRGQVTDIIPNPKGGPPTIRVKVTGKDGREGTIDVTPDQVAQAPEKARLDAPAPTPDAAPARATLDQLREMDTPALQAIIDDPNSTPDARSDAVKIRNNRQNAAALTDRPAATPGDIDSAKKSMTDLVNSKDVADAVALQRTQSQFGGGPLRAIDDAQAALDRAQDGPAVRRAANDLATALERLRDDLRSQSGAPGSTIGQQFRGIDMSSDRVKIQALDRAVQEARRRASSITAGGSDADVMIRWLHAMRDPDPDVVLVASLEVEAEQRGWNPLTVLRALTAKGFAADLHPRGRDGKFIEKLGIVELFDLKTTQPGQRGKVTQIVPDPTKPGKPNIMVQLIDKNGKPGRTVRVKPNNIGQAPEKARLPNQAPGGRRPGSTDAYGGANRGLETPVPLAPDQSGWGRGGTPRPRPAPGRDLAAEAEARNRRPESINDAMESDPTILRGPGPDVPRPSPTAADDARRLSDENIDLHLSMGTGGDWKAALETEKANRERRRAEDAQKRQALIDDVNAAAAQLSTTDPEERARGLDDILAKLRFSIIDTDKVHDNIYPPGDSGRWTPERNAQHEEMWNDLLSQVEASGIPRDHDALVLGGLPGAGKSYMLKPGQKADSFGVVSWEPNGPVPDGVTHVSVNPDIVKEMLIARGMLPEGISADLKPMEQVTFLHEESSYVAKMFSKRLGDLGYNVVLDNTMDSEQGMLKRMTPLARQGYKFRGIFADIPQEESLASAKKRYIDSALTPEGGRFVPSSVQGNRQSSKGNLSKNRDAMDSLVDQDWFTEYMIVDNTGVSQRTPKGEIVGQGTGAGSAAERYLPGADAAVPHAGPRLPTEPAAPPTIVV